MHTYLRLSRHKRLSENKSNLESSITEKKTSANAITNRISYLLQSMTECSVYIYIYIYLYLDIYRAIIWNVAHIGRYFGGFVPIVCLQ